MGVGTGDDVVTPFWTAFGASALAAYPIYRLLLLTKSRQTISQHAPDGHQLKAGTPTMGGLIILVGLLAALLAWPETRAYVPLLVMFAAIGFVDDFVVPRLMKGKRGLGWKQKIVMQLLGAILSGLILGVSGPWLAGFVFVVLFFSNAYNFADGLDGLAGGLLLAMAAFLVLLGGAWATLGLILVGATVPFLAFNAPPAKIFMGDVGSLPVGALLGAVATKALQDGVGFAPILLWSGVMIVELVPVPMQVLAVKTVGRRIFPYTPIHHAFEKAGLPETRVTAFFVILQILLSIGAATLAGVTL